MVERNEEGALETVWELLTISVAAVYDVADSAKKSHKFACTLLFAGVLEVAHAAKIADLEARFISIAGAGDYRLFLSIVIVETLTSRVLGTGRLGDRLSVCKVAGKAESLFNAKVSVINPNA